PRHQRQERQGTAAWLPQATRGHHAPRVRHGGGVGDRPSRPQSRASRSVGRGDEGEGVGLYSHVQNIDTSTPTGELVFNIMASMAQWEHSMIRDRVMAGLRRAKREGKRLGRPRVSSKVVEKVRERLDKGEPKTTIAKALGIDTKT